MVGSLQEVLPTKDIKMIMKIIRILAIIIIMIIIIVIVMCRNGGIPRGGPAYKRHGLQKQRSLEVVNVQ